jgi:hypothetical protein
LSYHHSAGTGRQVVAEGKFVAAGTVINSSISYLCTQAAENKSVKNDGTRAKRIHTNGIRFMTDLSTASVICKLI